MAAKTHGTAYLFGVDIAAYFAAGQVTSISVSKADKINEFVEDYTGAVVASRHDDQTDTLQATMRITSAFTRNTMAAKVTLATGDFAGDYRVTDISETKTAKGWTDYAVTMVKDEYLTLT